MAQSNPLIKAYVALVKNDRRSLTESDTVPIVPGTIREEVAARVNE
ncbi:CD1375 family protein [Aureibacillus halotolerans]|uniref:Uncharacterized protein n=1 Tax=Aureibacillus halotolerans TaxID=1508390 RepID=A0A4R6TS47_9BACI|nr:CD1375 family protein [Aureibacillus halotolerans]TDQ35297.1 hypothetical protein EV213_12284 [Aureibacillus halotolerans]